MRGILLSPCGLGSKPHPPLPHSVPRCLWQNGEMLVTRPLTELSVQQVWLRLDEMIQCSSLSPPLISVLIFIKMNCWGGENPISKPRGSTPPPTPGENTWASTVYASPDLDTREPAPI